MRSHLLLVVALLTLAASGALAESVSSSSGGGAAASSGGGGSHAGGGSGGGGGHGGGGTSGHGYSGGGGHGNLGSAFAERGGIGTQSLGRGSFAIALGSHGPVPTAAKNAVAVRTAAAGDPQHHPDPEHHHHHYRDFAGHGRRMHEFFVSCTAPRYFRYEDVGYLEFSSPCGDAFKARINPQTGQPIG
jgi:hypothetical protein